MGHPVKTPIVCCQGWDGGTMDIQGFGKEPWGQGPGPHMIFDLNGRGLKWKDVQNNMTVKIKAKLSTVNSPGYEWLFASSESKSSKLI